jgi:glycyl-tRNA synthetase
MFVQDREDMVGLDAAILMNPRVWEASGHVSGFSDPLVECVKCHHRFRADQVGDKCPDCGGAFGPVRQFNMMFKTHIGAMEDTASVSYLRPETAGGIFVNFKNVVDSLHPKLPFGIAQIGKAFRNEIAPRDFIFRDRELEQMEIEYFVRPGEWQEAFEEWRQNVHAFNKAIGIDAGAVHELEVPDGDRAHYSKRTIDFEFDFPFGRKELYGLAYRTDFDLSAHQNASGANLAMQDKEGEPALTPHVIEPSFGVERTMLAVLVSAYTEDELGGEKRTYLKFAPAIAPVKAAVFPLLKNKPELVAYAREVYCMLKKEIPQIMWDDNGNIGKRYRRQDEIGTPYCITVDFDTLGEKPEMKDTVTLRDRDTGSQERVSIDELVKRIIR